MTRRLPDNRYLDYYLLVSEIAFVKIVVDEHHLILKKKGYEFPPENAKVNMFSETIIGVKHIDQHVNLPNSIRPVGQLFAQLKSMITSDIYGITKSGCLKDFLIQHSMHYKPDKSRDWYKQFFADPLFLVKVIKENLHFASIDSWCFNEYGFTKPKIFDKIFEIVAIKLTLEAYGDNSFDMEVWLQSIDNKNECYYRSVPFNYHHGHKKQLAYAITWHNRQIEYNKPENRKRRAGRREAMIGWRDTGDWAFVERANALSRELELSKNVS